VWAWLFFCSPDGAEAGLSSGQARPFLLIRRALARWRPIVVLYRTGNHCGPGFDKVFPSRAGFS